jgi:hypothetical protein
MTCGGLYAGTAGPNATTGGVIGGIGALIHEQPATAAVANTSESWYAERCMRNRCPTSYKGADGYEAGVSLTRTGRRQAAGVSRKRAAKAIAIG